MNQALCSTLHSEVPSRTPRQMGEHGIQKYSWWHQCRWYGGGSLRRLGPALLSPSSASAGTTLGPANIGALPLWTFGPNVVWVWQMDKQRPYETAGTACVETWKREAAWHVWGPRSCWMWLKGRHLMEVQSRTEVSWRYVGQSPRGAAWDAVLAGGWPFFQVTSQWRCLREASPDHPA